MPLQLVKVNSTDRSVVIRILDSTAGTPEEGVTSATAGLALWYRRDGGLKVALSPSDLGALNSAHSDGGIIHADDGYYRLDIPDAAFVEGAEGVLIGGTATGMVIVGAYLQLTDNLADLWRTRTLTQSAASVTAAVSGSDLTIRRGDTFSASLTGLGSLSGYVSLDFAVKVKKSDSDDDAIVRIRLNASGSDDGLLRLNKQEASNADNGSITIDDAGDGDITITLAAAETQNLVKAEDLFYDVQVITASAVMTLTEGNCDVTEDVMRAVT